MREQFRAIARASAFGRVQMLLPMVLKSTAGKRRGLLPVRFGQRAHAPAIGRSVSSCRSNGAIARDPQHCSEEFAMNAVG